MIIETICVQKRFFNENTKKDIEEVKYFFTNHAWKKGCPFILEYPYMTIPDMLKDKLTHKALGIKFDNRHHWD